MIDKTRYEGGLNVFLQEKFIPKYSKRTEFSKDRDGNIVEAIVTVDLEILDSVIQKAKINPRNGV